MPCDIGVRNTVSVKIEEPVRKNLRMRVKAEELDRDLLEKLGEEDNEFLDWLGELDTEPILKEALRLTAANLGISGKNIFLKDGYLEVRGQYATAAEKEKIEKLADEAGRRFQMETLNAIAKLLGYATAILSRKDGYFQIAGEREGELGVHKYMDITKNADGSGNLRFEHFAAKKELRAETAKFLALSGKFGIKFTVDGVEEAGTESGAGVSQVAETERRRV